MWFSIVKTQDSCFLNHVSDLFLSRRGRKGKGGGVLLPGWLSSTTDKTPLLDANPHPFPNPNQQLQLQSLTNIDHAWPVHNRYRIKVHLKCS